MFLRLLLNLVTIGAYLFAIPVAIVVLVWHLVHWMCKDIAREWRS